MLLGAHWSLEIVEKRFEVFKQQTHLARFTAELLDFVVAGKVPYYVIEAIDSIAGLTMMSCCCHPTLKWYNPIFRIVSQNRNVEYSTTLQIVLIIVNC